MVKHTLRNYIIMSLFIHDKTTLYSDLLQSNDNSMHSSNDYLFVNHIFLSRTLNILCGLFMRRHKYYH